jgi:excisionase family DNA binding protein
MDQLTLKRAPLPPALAVGQDARFGLLGAAMLRNQQQNLALFGERPLSLREAAVALNVSMQTLRRWIKIKLVNAIKVGRYGHYKLRPAEIRRVLEGNVVQGDQNG